jgi:hypothetical protein
MRRNISGRMAGYMGENSKVLAKSTASVDS